MTPRPRTGTPFGRAVVGITTVLMLVAVLLVAGPAVGAA